MPKKSRESAAQALAEALLDYLDCMASPAVKGPEAKLYGLDELAKMFGKSKGTIRQWVCGGEFGEPVKAGSSTLVTQEGLERYIANHSGPVEKRQVRQRRGKVSPQTLDLQQYRI